MALFPLLFLQQPCEVGPVTNDWPNDYSDVHMSAGIRTLFFHIPAQHTNQYTMATLNCVLADTFLYFHHLQSPSPLYELIILESKMFLSLHSKDHKLLGVLHDVVMATMRLYVDKVLLKGFKLPTE